MTAVYSLHNCLLRTWHVNQSRKRLTGNLFFFLENQGKGPLFTEIDYRDSGRLELWEAILLTMQDGNLHEGHQHRGTWSPEIKKRDGSLKAFFGPLDPAVSRTGIAPRVTFKLLS